MEGQSNSTQQVKSGTQEDPLQIRESEWKRMVFKDFSLEYFKQQEEYFFMGEHVLSAAKESRVKTPLQTLEKHFGSLKTIHFATKGLLSVPVLNYGQTKKLLKVLATLEKSFPAAQGIMSSLKKKLESKKESKQPTKKQKTSHPPSKKQVLKKEPPKPKKANTTSRKKEEPKTSEEEKLWELSSFVQEWYENFVEQGNGEAQERLQKELKKWISTEPALFNSLRGKFFKVHAKDCLLHKAFDDVGIAEHTEFEELPCFYCERVPMAFLSDGENVRMATKSHLKGAESTGIDIFQLDQDLLTCTFQLCASEEHKEE